MAGLLLSSLIANNLFADNPDRENKAAAGISHIIEDLLVAMPTFVKRTGGEKEARSEDIQSAESLLLSQGKNEKAFARILTCVNAPLSRDADGSVPHESCAVWSACAFALWCLLKTHPKPAKLANIRASIPFLAQYGPCRVRWLSGELLLHLHVEENASTTPKKSDVHSEAIGFEQNAVEAAMSEQLNHAVQSIQDGLQEKSNMRQQQENFTKERQQALAIGADGSCFTEINKALASLIAARDRLAKASDASNSAEAQSASSLDGLSAALEVDSQASQGDLDGALQGVQGIESHYLGKRDELTQLEEQLRQQGAITESCKNDMENEDRAVTDTRKRLIEMETKLSSKQREAQQQRTLASSDLSSQKATLTRNCEEIDTNLLKLRDKAQKLQNGEPLEAGQAPVDTAKVQEVMADLKQQAAKLKQKKAEYQAELGKSSVDPATAQENALKLESEADELRDQINFVRVNELQELERSHATKREAWQRETSRVQEIRSIRDSLDREVAELKRQLDERWKTWRPLWSARLNHWHEKASALSEAQLRSHQFSEKVTTTYQMLNDEDAARAEVLRAVASAQEQLSALQHQLTDIADLQ
jgi:chromosome segregation ATPase